MTLPYERSRSVVSARAFLRALLNPRATPKVPKWIREEAARCLKHYPGQYDMNCAAAVLPTNFEQISFEEARESEDAYFEYLQAKGKL